MTVHPDSDGMDREERIRAVAYDLWEQDGRPEGRSEEHWLRACGIIDAAEAAEPGWLKRQDEPAPEPAADPPPEPTSSQLAEALNRLKRARAG